MRIPAPIELGSLGMADSLILMVLALVVFGPRRLPQIGRQIGKLMYEFRKASNDFKFQMEEELRLSEEADRRKKEEEQRRQLAASQPKQESVSATPAVANAIESGTGADGYPPVTGAGVTNPAEDTPRILPPSTGERVAAERPSRASGTEQAEQLNNPSYGSAPATPPGASAQSAGTTDSPSHDSAPTTEAVR